MKCILGHQRQNRIKRLPDRKIQFMAFCVLAAIQLKDMGLNIARNRIKNGIQYFGGIFHLMLQDQQFRFFLIGQDTFRDLSNDFCHLSDTDHLRSCRSL
ncbi:hypothetical protein B6K69_17840 (plasmid) [Fuscovulum blasticum]|nr:hypothetical protein B6K69_17840 [Fuscovulum blasticum]